jgi:hypothetical protein
LDNVVPTDIKVPNKTYTALVWYNHTSSSKYQTRMIQILVPNDDRENRSLVCRSCTSDEVWFTSYLIDHLKQYLATYTEVITNNEGESTVVRPYCDQAFRLLKIGRYNPPQPYIIKFSHLTSRLRTELNQLDGIDRIYVLKQAVSRIFEDVNIGIYHNSVSHVLRVVLQR